MSDFLQAAHTTPIIISCLGPVGVTEGVIVGGGDDVAEAEGITPESSTWLLQAANPTIIKNAIRKYRNRGDTHPPGNLIGFTVWETPRHYTIQFCRLQNASML